SVIQPLVDRSQEAARRVKSVDQIGCQNQVVAGELLRQVAGIGLRKMHPLTDLVQTKIFQPYFVERNHLPFLGKGIAQVPLFLHAGGQAEEAGGEIQSGNFIKPAFSQFERSPSHGAPQVKGMTFLSRFHSCKSNLCPGHGKVWYAEVLRTVVGVAVLGSQGIALVLVVMDLDLRTALHVAEARMLKEVAPEGISGVTRGLVAGGDPGAPLDQ